MKSILLALLAVIVALGDCGSTLAAKKKIAPPSPPKLIYEAPMTVVIVRNSVSLCEPNCPEWIAAEGEITDGTPAKFREVFKRMGKKQLPIIIRSPGGSINAALEIGKMVRKRKLDVAVGSTQFTGCGPNRKDCKLPKEDKSIYRGTASSFYGFCNSACPLILAAGTVRLASAETLVGVHKPKIVWEQERVYYRETYRMVNGKKKVLKRTVTGRKRGKDKVTFEFGKQLRKKLAGYYASMGVDPAIMVDSEKAAHKDIEILRGDRLDTLKLRTSSRNAGTLTDWNICRRELPIRNCVKDKDFKLALGQGAQLPQASGPATPASQEPPMTFTVVRSGSEDCEPTCVEWIAAEGMIMPDSANRLKRVLDAIGGPKRLIVLNSGGGDLAAAIALGQLFDARGLAVAAAYTTYMHCRSISLICKVAKNSTYRIGDIQRGGVCRDACLVALAGGKWRIADTASITGDGLGGLARAKSKTGKALEQFLQQQHVKPDFVAKLIATSSGKQAYFDMDDMLTFNLVTAPRETHWLDRSEFCISPESPSTCVRR